MSENGAKKKRIDELDYVRAFAIFHIFMYHYYMEWFGGSFLIVPEGIGANIDRIQVFSGGGFFDVIKNLFSFLFVYGFTSVNLFLVLSGFVLTYSLINKGGIKKVKSWIEYFWSKFKRIFLPFFISVFIGILFLYFRNFLWPELGGAPIYGWFDVVKLFFLPFLFFDIQFLQKFNGDYWFVPLILQLYLAFPVLFYLLNRLKIKWFLILFFLITVSYRFVASYYLDSVPMGVLYPAEHSYRLFSFFVPRLFEFCFGMAIAYKFVNSDNFLQRFYGIVPFFSGILLTFSGYFLNMNQWGWAFSDLFVAVGLFVTTLNLGRFFARNMIVEKLMKKISETAYEIFLLHHYFLNYFLLPLLVVLGVSGQEVAFWVVMPIYIILSVSLGVAGRYLSLLLEEVGRRGVLLLQGLFRVR